MIAWSRIARQPLIILASTAILAPSARAQTGSGIWRSLGLDNHFVVGLTVDPSNPLTLYAGTNQILRSTDGGGTWANVGSGIFCPNFGPISIDPRDPRVLYAVISCSGGIFRSLDSGESWRQMIGGDIWPLFLDVNDPSILYSARTLPSSGNSARDAFEPPVGQSRTLIRSTDGGKTWNDLPLSTCGTCGFTFATSRQSPGTVYGVFGGPYLEKSTDYGLSWSLLGQSQWIQLNSLALDPADASIMLASGTAHGEQGQTLSGVFRSTDGGLSWAAASTGLADTQIVDVVFHPIHPAIAFAGTETGKVFASTDGGLSWADQSTGLPSASSLTLSFDPEGKVLYAASVRGLFALQLGTTGGCVSDPQALCLQGGRFQVSVEWLDFQRNSGLASVVPGAVSDNAGIMWFFSPDNWELLIKVLDGCVVNGHYWVLGAAATNVAYTIQVTDTQTGEIRTYTNPLGTVSPAITDTSAFGSCP